ncbi:MAG: hypothetical protein DMF69_22440 [Acidobacteria bacterium]|nr:MAG: hypothetical protein DMF69_22440 [Acidobacteriota bacterium]
MPNIDISRDATDPRKHYDRVQMQQGRVLTDDDFNEAERLDAEDSRRVRVDVIGPAGSPDDGFKLKTVGANLVLSAGTYYTGGLRLELQADEPFNLQNDWLQQGSRPGETLTQPAGAQFDFVWLDVWQQPVSAVEDKELFEVALGGADTSARVRTMRRAHVLPNVGDVDCADAWTQLLASLAGEGTLNSDFELVPDARLTVEPDGTAGTDDLCSPPVNGGYLGAENQAIRVQISGNNQFTWGFDNGAPLYRVKLVADNTGALRKIHMLTVPKDQAHYPLEGQVIELLPWSALLSNGQKNAELSGFMAKVDGGYNPDTQDLHITAAPGNDTGAPPMPFGQRWTARADAAAINNEDPPDDGYFYMRVWNRGGDTQSPAAINFVPGTPVSLAKTGLQVTFSGANLRRNDFWIIAARPETPNTVVPWELSTGRAPHGVRRWIAPLGMIHWPGGDNELEVTDDCRPTFLPLTKIKGCCSYTVGDGTHSFGNFLKIQNAVNVNRRVAITIHGCGKRTRVQSIFNPNGADEPAFLITNSTEITLEDMAIESGPRSAVQIGNSRHVTVQRCLIQMRDRPTIWQAIFSRGDDVLIDSNTIEVLPREGGPPVPTVPPDVGTVGAPSGVHTPPDPIVIGFATRGGVQLGGGSDRVRVSNNTIRGGIWNGITLGSIEIIGQVDPVDNPDKPNSEDPCDPCRPVDLGDDDPGGVNIRIRSAGDLYDIEIVNNKITDMGINGIGVVRFFNLANGGDLIGVHGLHITDNFITRCMRRNIAQVSEAMQFLMGYGGISLAKVSDLRILRNEIINNGVSHLQPICGVFAIFVQGLQLDDNRIINNGPRTEAPVENAQTGNRGGVHIWIILPVIEVTSVANSLWKSDRQRVTSIPTCSMRDNIIVAPLGRAVTFFAAGAVVVNRNRLVTEGSTLRNLDRLATTVLIGNLGLSNEWTLGLVIVLILIIVSRKDMSEEEICQLAKLLGLLNPGPPVSFWPPLVRKWVTGKTLICENQITFDVPDEPLGFAISSVFVLSLDDLGMTDNQCELTSTNQFLFANAILAAGSVREADNRFAETWMHVALSTWSIGGMNTTTDNQSTHCMRATSLMGLRVFRDNLALVSAFCPRECSLD